MRLGSNGSTSVSGDMNSMGGSIKLEARHFKSKEGSVWLNMFESLSNVRLKQQEHPQIQLQN